MEIYRVGGEKCMKKNSIAIITARGGSKRIPKKNIKEFYGKPIIAYSIEAALSSNQFDEVMVSTDSVEIAEIARKYGANVPFFRSSKTSSDTATTSEVLMEVLSEYNKQGVEFEYMCCIYPTAPFVTAQKLRDAMKLIKDKEPLQIIPVVKYEYPPQRAFFRNDKNLLEFVYSEHRTTRSQDLETYYHDAGQFYVCNVKKFIEYKGKLDSEIMPIIVPEMEVQDIDNEEDWKLAELKYNIMMENMKNISEK